jgi:transketolase
MRKQFRDTITDLHNDKIVLILGDVSVYLFNEFTQNNPDRVYNLAICENSLISVSAGLSSLGFIPFVHTINPFICDRSYEQIKGFIVCTNGINPNEESPAETLIKEFSQMAKL